TASVLSGKCGPCCSIAPIGRHSTEPARTAVATSPKTRWPIIRLAGPTGTGQAVHHAHEDAVLDDEMMIKRRRDMDDDQRRNGNSEIHMDPEHRFREQIGRAHV